MSRQHYSGRDLRRALDIEDLRRMALARLPNFVAEYLEGGSEDERTLRNNLTTFNDHHFVHRVLVDVAERSVASTLFDKPTSMPMVVGPTGFNGLFWRHGDIAMAHAARKHDIPFTVSIMSSDSLQAIAKEAGGRLWMMLLVIREPQVVERLIATADDVGCEALVITLDAAVFGNRTWDSRNFSAPLQLSLRSKLDVLLHARWMTQVLFRGLPEFGNLSELLPPGKRNALDGARYLTAHSDASLTWDAIRALRDRWPRKLILKGILAVEDAERAAQLGVDGIILSNHGGRQLDGDVAPMQVLADVVERVGKRVEVMIDGGFRRGTDIAKALALGARAVVLGRAPLYGLAAGGEEGAHRALDILRAELDRTLALLGCPSCEELSPKFVHSSRVGTKPVKDVIEVTPHVRDEAPSAVRGSRQKTS
ncbi:MAG: alpha-hydroxy-acid oxidizing protein [Myxococcota bacterium]|nr:alpha-hydroxy-acid oxidizing protein [Deltaproteobacteria bacterium]MDQ3334970.1 alpha-hydroxy-acid oxidizing protein [Myxococcota bacterium]